MKIKGFCYEYGIEVVQIVCILCPKGVILVIYLFVYTYLVFVSIDRGISDRSTESCHRSRLKRKKIEI